MRITTEEEARELATSIKDKVPSEKMEEFLAARLVPYSKGKHDTYITIKEGKVYLPYPYNKVVVGMLYSDTDPTIDDEFDI